MIKKLKLGLSAMVAFAMMFATTVVVAQEQANAPKNEVEVKESVKAMVLAEAISKLKTDVTPTNDQVLFNVAKSESLKGNTKVQEDPKYWYPVNAAGTHTSSSNYNYGTRSEVLSMSCGQDSGTPCLFGSDNPNLTTGTPIGTPSVDDAIFRTD